MPRQVIFLDEIPKGPTGKIQRIGLAEKLGLDEISSTEKRIKNDLTPPRNPIEQSIAAIWQEVLGINSLSVHHRFLDLGGDSLLATRLVSLIRDRLDIELSLIDFFDAGTVAEQAPIVQELLLQEIDDSV